MTTVIIWAGYGLNRVATIKKPTNISVDVNLLAMYIDTHRVLWEVFPVQVDLINAA